MRTAVPTAGLAVAVGQYSTHRSATLDRGLGISEEGWRALDASRKRAAK